VTPNYLPLNALKRLAENVWMVDGPIIPLRNAMALRG
jgi:hypothetical protein